MQRMRAEREQHEQELARLRQHTLHAMAEDRARHTAEEKELEALIARNSAELRQMQLDEQRRLSEEQARRQWQQQQLTASVLQEQVSNPLGLFYTADAVQDAADVFPEIRRASSGFAGSACVVPSAPPLEALGSNPSASSSASSASAKQKEAEAAGSSAAAGVSTLEAPPPYSERAPSSTSAAPPAYGAPATITVAGTEMPRAAADATARVLQEMDNHAPPPVYAESDLFALQPSLRVTGAFVPTQAQAAPGDRLPRCASCFDQIAPEPDRGFNGQAMRSGASLYHLECYLKKAAPSCAHCTETLIAHPEKGLSGHYGIYKGQKYHVECYQYHVGPRYGAVLLFALLLDSTRTICVANNPPPPPFPQNLAAPSATTSFLQAQPTARAVSGGGLRTESSHTKSAGGIG